MDSNNYILFLVSQGNAKMLIWARDRDQATWNARSWIGGCRDNYIVTTLTNTGDRIKMEITLNV